jgi:hypothetical protein
MTAADADPAAPGRPGGAAAPRAEVRAAGWRGASYASLIVTGSTVPDEDLSL